MNYQTSDLLEMIFVGAFAALMTYLYGYLPWFKPQKFREFLLRFDPKAIANASFVKSKDFIWMIWTLRIGSLILLILFLLFSIIYTLQKLGFDIFAYLNSL